MAVAEQHQIDHRLPQDDANLAVCEFRMGPDSATSSAVSGQRSIDRGEPGNNGLDMLGRVDFLPIDRWQVLGALPGLPACERFASGPFEARPNGTAACW